MTEKTPTKEINLRDRITNLEMDLKESRYEEWERGKEIVLFEKLFNAHKGTLPGGYVKAIEKILNKFDDRCIMPTKDPIRPLDRRAYRTAYERGYDRGMRSANKERRKKKTNSS